MPNIRKLEDSEVRSLERRRLGTRRATAVEYDRYLSDFAPGDYGEVLLDPSENRLTVRNRLKKAAERRDPPLVLTFMPTRGDLMRFRVGVASAPEPSQHDGDAVSSEAPPRGSRTRKR